jgi:hypothetical protein
MIKWVKSLVSNLRLRYTIFRTEQSVARDFDSAIHIRKQTNDILQDSIKYAYDQGIGQIKKKINQSAGAGGHHQVLSAIGDNVLHLAEGEDSSSKNTAKTLRDVFVYSQEKPKEAMIDDRIDHYYQLQNYNEERQLIKAIKVARKEGDNDRAQQLEADWNRKYRSRLN